MRKKRRIKWGNVIILFFFLLCFGCCIVSLIEIIKWKKDSNKTTEQIKNIQEIIEVEEVIDSETVEIIEQEEIDPANPYWDYIKMNLIDVNFQELKQINSSTKGWLQVNGTNINYPFVQAQDNKYYLTHSFDKTYNNAGWLFLDYRNDSVGVDKNSIIYAHGRDDKTMFGTLRTILKSGWLNNQNNYVLKVSTETENCLWQVFSIYHIPNTTDYLRISFNDDKDFYEFATMLLDRSDYNFNTSVSSQDKILTLSTCYDDNVKVVLHAKLIKREAK